MGTSFPSDKFPGNKAFSALPCPKVGWSDPPPLDYYGNPIPPPEVDMGPQWQQQMAEMQDAIFNINPGPVQNNDGPGEQEDIDFPWFINVGNDIEPVLPVDIVTFAAAGDDLTVALTKNDDPDVRAVGNQHTVTYTIADTVLSSFIIKDDDNDAQTVNDGEFIKFIGKTVELKRAITTDLAEAGGNHTLTIGLDLTELPGYDNSKTQVIGHEGSDPPTWLDTEAC